MKYISLEEFLNHKEYYINEAKAGKIFVYPTDTVYGIGAIYTPENQKKIFAIKRRDEKKAFSLIAPTFQWIQEQYHITPDFAEKLPAYLDQYHGVTYIFDYNTPGVRIIKHPIQEFVQTLNEGFITTSCNISGEPIVTQISDIPKEIADEVDYVIDGGILGGKPSVLIDFVADKIIVR